MDQNVSSVKRKMETESNDAKIQKTERSIENPAVAFLNWIRKSNAYENIPLAIDVFVLEYGKYREAKNAKVVDQATQMISNVAFDRVRELEEEVHLSLRKLENKGFWRFLPKPVCSVIKSLVANIKRDPPNQSISPPSSASWNETEFIMEDDNDTVVISRAHPSRHGRYGAQQLLSVENQNYENYVTSSGKSPKLNKIIRSSFCKLHFLIKDFTIVMKAADKLDRVLFGAFHLSLYSQDFWQLCEYWNTCADTSDESSFAYQEFQRVVETVASAQCRENLYEMNKNVDIVKKLKSLAEFLNDDFYKMVAIWYACEIFNKFPLNYHELHEKMCLEWLQDCCEILNYVMLNEYHSGVHSVDIKKSIDRLHVILSKMKLLFHW